MLLIKTLQRYGLLEYVVLDMATFFIYFLEIAYYLSCNMFYNMANPLLCYYIDTA